MESNTPLDYAVLQLSPKRSRCELLISSNGSMEKLASGFVKPFVTHLKIAEEQVADAVNSVKLAVERHRHGESWFTKGTLERFLRFVNTPEVLEMVNTFDAEMSQLEAARKIYSQGSGDQLSGGGDGKVTMAGADATKKELLRAIDVRLTAVKQDLTIAFRDASAAGFNPATVSELQLFADCFGAHRLNEACTKFISLCQRRPDLIRPAVIDQLVRASWGSDMSIDDPADDPSGSRDIRAHQSSFQWKQAQQQAGQEEQKQLADVQAQHHLHLSKLSTCNQPDSSLPTEEKNIRKESKKEEKKKEDSPDLLPSQPSQPARRLSVQDRINLFENKQKENSGGKTVGVGKSAELRRLSSDVSSAPALEKAVLRRWSGTSDMSIDLGNDKKEGNSTDSPLCTPSSSVSQAKSNTFPGLSEDGKDTKGLNDAASSVKVEVKSMSGLKDQGQLQICDDGVVGNEVELELKGKVNRKDQGSSLAISKPFTDREEQDGVADHVIREEKMRFREDRRGVKDQVHIEGKSRTSPEVVDAALQNNIALRSQNKSSASRVGNLEIGKRAEDVETRDQAPSCSQVRGPQTHSRSFSGQFEGGFGIKYKEVPLKETKGDQSGIFGEVKQVGRKESASSGKEDIDLEDSDVSRMKVQKPLLAGLESRKLQHRAEESSSISGSIKPVFPGKKVSDRQESFGFVQSPSIEQSQRVRQSKGNQELNDELKMKANELEKLFAEHKLRTPVDQSVSTRRSKTVETHTDQTVFSQYKKSVTVEISPLQFQDKKIVPESVGDTGDYSMFSTPPTKIVDHQDYESSLRQNFSELSFSDDSRGKFYEKYMQKRDAKLREEWGTKRAEKEAKLKSMQDTLERSRAEMKAKLSGSTGRWNSASNGRKHAEKLRSINSRSGVKRDKPLDSFRSEEDEDLSEFPEQKSYGQERSFNDTSLGDSAGRSSQNKKQFPNRNLPSSTPRTAAAPVPRSSAKISNTGSARRRGQSENLLAQSVPNFSDFRKENTKPSGISKTTNRLQVRTYSRSKSTSEEVPLAKEEKARWSQSLRSTAGPAEYKDPLDSDDVLAPLKFDRGQMEQGPNDRFPKNAESKTFLRKGNGVGPGIGASIPKQNALLGSEMMTKEEESEFLPVEAKDLAEVTQEEEEELENMDAEDCADIDNGKLRLSQESEKMATSGSENGDSMRSLSQIDPSSVADLPASVPSTFHAIGSLQESPGESPVLWNLQMHHPFSYPHEISDIDAYVDSPMGSPPSWNSHSLTQTDADAARMRKKWGSAQKPFLVANSSQNQGRKDVTKGFKRLLKFRRKSRGTESLVDWISATTSEGDDDTEDGRDPANRSSEDLRKSRMGYVQGQPPDDGFNDSELFNEQVRSLQGSIPVPPANFKLRDDHMSGTSIKAPRSFFSLSTFRNKGSDSKPR